MAEAIRIAFAQIRVAFDLSPGGRRYRPARFTYPTTEDAWNSDWQNIGGDFRRATSRIEQESVQ